MVAKQADTIMLSYPLGVEMSPTVRKNDLVSQRNMPPVSWPTCLALVSPAAFHCVSSSFTDNGSTYVRSTQDYYANHTGNGPSMTWSMYLVGYLEIGELEQAAEFFNKSWLPYVVSTQAISAALCDFCSVGSQRP